MTIRAEIVKDSISPTGIRLVTMQLKYPKFIHGEFMTHRVFSRNASIPVERLIQDVIDDPAMPVSWGKNQAGMQAGEELSEKEAEQARQMWLAARDDAVQHALHLKMRGLHKQIINRILEPYCHINVVVTATEWANFYGLRCHPDADPTMHALADAMQDAHDASTPEPLRYGDWHLPYFDPLTALQLPSNPRLGQSDYQWFTDLAVRVSVARCARVSYLTHDGRRSTVEEDLRLYDRLVGSHPLHASPAEHQATPDAMVWNSMEDWHWKNPELHGNLFGYIQHRKTLPNEQIGGHR